MTSEGVKITLTKGALYRWSYGSTNAVFTIVRNALQAGLVVWYLASD
jgi:hypothetical protein